MFEKIIHRVFASWFRELITFWTLNMDSYLNHCVITTFLMLSGCDFPIWDEWIYSNLIVPDQHWGRKGDHRWHIDPPSTWAGSRVVCSGPPVSRWGFLSAPSPSTSGSWTRSTSGPLQNQVEERERKKRWDKSNRGRPGIKQERDVGWAGRRGGRVWLQRNSEHVLKGTYAKIMNSRDILCIMQYLRRRRAGLE